MTPTDINASIGSDLCDEIEQVSREIAERVETIRQLQERVRDLRFRAEANVLLNGLDPEEADTLPGTMLDVLEAPFVTMTELVETHFAY